METKHYFTRLRESMIKYWDKAAISDFEGEISYSFGELAARIAKMEILFEQLGLKPGDKIAICGRNSSNWAASFLSIMSFRGVAVCILPEFTSESIYELVAHSEAKVLFVGPWVRGRIDLSLMPSIDTFIAIQDLSIMQSKTAVETETIDKIFAERYPNGFRKEDIHFPEDNWEDLAIINYTSGSTGSPKGVMLTHSNLSHNVREGQQFYPIDGSKRIVSILPLAHMFGLMFELMFELCGGAHITFITRSLTPALLMKAFHDVKPHIMATVPLLLEKIVKKSIFPVIQKPIVKVLWYTPGINILLRRKVKKNLMKALGGELDVIAVGGAALSPDVEKCLRQIKLPYTCVYGMTECAPGIAAVPPKEFKYRSCGKIVEGMELKVDSENPRKVPGEILIRGVNVMRGYYKNMQATDNVFTEDGWLRTGDIGVVDRKGYLYLRGRSKNMILSASGQNIYPEEIEDQLNSMDGVAESVVVERDGKLVALVFPELAEYADWDWERVKAEIAARMAENLQKLNKQLPNYSKLSDIELQEKEFEKTPKKSIKRFLYK